MAVGDHRDLGRDLSRLPRGERARSRGRGGRRHGHARRRDELRARPRCGRVVASLRRRLRARGVLARLPERDSAHPARRLRRGALRARALPRRLPPLVPRELARDLDDRIDALRRRIGRDHGAHGVPHRGPLHPRARDPLVSPRRAGPAARLLGGPRVRDRRRAPARLSRPPGPVPHHRQLRSPWRARHRCRARARPALDGAAGSRGPGSGRGARRRGRALSRPGRSRRRRVGPPRAGVRGRGRARHEPGGWCAPRPGTARLSREGPSRHRTGPPTGAAPRPRRRRGARHAERHPVRRDGRRARPGPRERQPRPGAPRRG